MPRLLVICVAGLLGCNHYNVDPAQIGTGEQRVALFEQLVEQTMAREAFSPPKNAALGLSMPEDLQAVRTGFLEAVDGHALYLAINRLSCARRDRHLYVQLVSRQLFDPRAMVGGLPLRFAADFEQPGFYVSDLPAEPGRYFTGPVPSVGDLVTQAHGFPIDEWVTEVRPYVRYSTEAGGWEVLARQLARRSMMLPAELNPEMARLELQRADGTRYQVQLEYRDTERIAWQGAADPSYAGFEPQGTSETFTWYLHRERPVILIAWNAFGSRCVADTRDLLAVARERGLLDHAVIFDATRARGGSGGADVLRQLSPRPFRTTFGNLRISDVTPKFIQQLRDEMRRRQVGSSWLSDWLETDVTAAIAAGDDYSNNVPFKLAHLPKDSDGIMQPARVHFRGPLVLLLSPHGGSHLDQFAAMVIDNELGRSIGMPAGGYSNTWEWTEPVGLPGGPSLVRFMWSIGHTIRPNGEILEGNPAMVTDYVARTRDNHAGYPQMLLERALQAIEQATDASR